MHELPQITRWDPSRHQPRAGDAAEIVHLGACEAAVVTATDGGSVQVVTTSGELVVFDLNRLTAHFIRRGEPYWGTRLELRSRPAVEDGSSP